MNPLEALAEFEKDPPTLAQLYQGFEPMKTTNVNVWTTTNPQAWNVGRQFVMFITGTLEEDMRVAAQWFGCAITELKFTTKEMTDKEIQDIQTEEWDG